MAQSYQTNLLNVAFCYIKKLKLPVTATSLRQRLLENPYYPSLFSVSNAFEKFHIPHEAFTLEKDNFEQLTAPFIAYLKNQPTGKDFVLVTSITNKEVSYIADSKKIKTISKEKFLSNWEKIVLKAEADNKSGEKEFQLNRKKEIVQANKTYLLIAASVLIFLSTVYFFLNSLSANFIASAVVILTIKLLGLAVSVLLLIYEIDKSNAFVKSICTAGKQSNCNAVLQSKASKIFVRKDFSGGMSWSEAGFFYFAATFLFLFFPAIPFRNKITVISIASCIATPYILFSVYYQWKVVKQWCPLCLIVQGILLTELIWVIVNFRIYPFSLAVFLPTVFLITATCLLIPLTGWYIIKPILLKAKDESVYKASYKRLLYNPDTFYNLLQQQSTAPDGYQNIGITVGDPNAENTIIKVCNPYCGPCATAHATIDEILHNNKNIKLKLIFFTTNDDKGINVSKYLLAISQKKARFQIQQALDDWYLSPKKDYKSFAAKYPHNFETDEFKKQEVQINEMNKWCKEAGISGTPTLFINGYKLPSNYEIGELKYIL